MSNYFTLSMMILLQLLLSGGVTDLHAECLSSRINFSTIAAGNNTSSGVPENRKIELFTDQASLDSALAEFVQPATEHRIDFATRQVVLLSMGGRRTGGYSIAAETIEDNGDHITLQVVLSVPGKDCVTTQALTSPFQFIEVESINELIVEERLVVVDCSE